MHLLSLKTALERKGIDIPPRAGAAAPNAADTPTRSESLASLQAAKPKSALWTPSRLREQSRPLLARPDKRAVDLPRFLPRP